MKTYCQRLALALLASSALSVSAPVFAQSSDTLRLAAQADAGTMDPHAQNTQITLSIQSMIYEPLVMRDADQQLIGGLAASWENVEPTLWRFALREGVTFHDGSAFSAEDVVYSITRAKAPTSQFAGFVGNIAEVRAVDDMTVEIVTTKPDALMADKLTYVLMIDSAWAEANSVGQPQDLRNNQETFAVLNTNGTGPFKLESREPDTRTVLVRNADYWGETADDFERVVFTPISSPPTRIAALISDEVDLVLDVPSQDVQRLESTEGVKVLTRNDTRTVFFGFDLGSEDLEYASVEGNPFLDVKVRQAVAYAIDAEAISQRIMRGLSRPTGMVISPDNLGYAEDLDAVHPVDIEKAKALMVEAGYPDGFRVTLDCPTDSYVNGDQICRAVATMLAPIGIQLDLNLLPRAQFLPKLWERDTSFYIMGFNSPYFDGTYFAETVLMTQDQATGEGIYNYSGNGDAELDALVTEAKDTLDRDGRAEKLKAVYSWVAENQLYVPVHQQLIVYAMRDRVDTNVRADGWFDIRFATIE
ncbi:peptide/nickel transport system substrate-binding protein [Devosia enhydra]|uniref:Peptide/nickel transport system substrate-binding protein n=1 Tax=Devosia enhydra TaxID=665118 RepID=A0A1K2HY45_9HYPH|nr:ABC transporter substrate-binding protein [Devosia enhydra]SFZ83373.1 peptide/nickel transport system substrate-binding protein [Devosia enhydra]